MTAVTGQFTFQFNERRLEMLKKKLGPDILMPPLSELIRTLGDLALASARSNAPSVLANRFDPVRVSPLTSIVRVSGPGVRAMEAGRKPLVAGGRYPPPQAFAYITGDLSAQWAIATAVAQRGTKGRFFMKKAKAAAWRELPQLIRFMSSAIERKWAEE